jgi:hypothetical protein
MAFLGIFFAACEKPDTTDMVEKGGYPRTAPEPSSHPADTPIEKPAEEEFFETNKRM